MGRTPVLTRTDLLVSHELPMRGTQAAALRAERPEPVQPEDGDAHLQLPEQGRHRPGIAVRRSNSKGRQNTY